MKINTFSIENTKIFKNFSINFENKNGEPLPIIVIAGINGSGKTTLLESIYNFKKNKEKIIYFSTETNLENIKKLIHKYLEKIVWSEDILASVAFKKVREYIDNIFQDLNIEIEFDSRDGEGNLFFKNKYSGDKFLIDDISTGEKTLVSKVLYLYLEDIKNKVILIDEPELSLHPSWQNKVLKIYENFAIKNNCQIIIATHSPHIIGSCKNEYLRILRKKEDGNIEVIDDVLAYGRDIKWVLKEMGVKNSRIPEISKKIEYCKELLEDDNYDEAENCIDEIENIIGNNDRDVLVLRNSLEFWRD